MESARLAGRNHRCKDVRPEWQFYEEKQKKPIFLVDPPRGTLAGTVITHENTQRKAENFRESTVGSRSVILKRMCRRGV